jgi:hypothetical protein
VVPYKPIQELMGVPGGSGNYKIFPKQNRSDNDIGKEEWCLEIEQNNRTFRDTHHTSHQFAAQTKLQQLMRKIKAKL